MDERRISFESIQWEEGSHAYLIRDESLSGSDNVVSPTLEDIGAAMEKEAQFTEEVRRCVEGSGGKFLGIRTLNINVAEPKMMGRVFPHRLTYILAYIP